jgi:cyclopropane-fatty-acyl-phospholipid synthase
MSTITLAEHKLLPDSVVRFGIKKLLKQRLQVESANDPEQREKRHQQLLEHLRQSPIAIETAAANAQHYEIPAAFYKYALGKHLKYSSCYWDEQTENLDQAEARMLALTAERAELADGQQILELGCGWGSLTLWTAEHFPNSRITAVSNSNSQREYIQQQAKQRSLGNIEVITCDVNQLTLDKQFDRIVSVEMFEHMRNYDSLLSKIASWLKVDGKLFVHIFCHRYLAYTFESEGEDNWMGRYFFTGGTDASARHVAAFSKRFAVRVPMGYARQSLSKNGRGLAG